MSAISLFTAFALLQNIDNFALAAAYRLKGVRIPIRPNVLVALLSAIATGIPVLIVGSIHTNSHDVGLGDAGEVIGRGILIMIGMWTLVSYFRSRLFPRLGAGDGQREEGERTQWPEKRRARPPMKTSEAVIAGTALALDNIAPSFAVGLLPTGESAAISALTLGTLVATCSIAAVALAQFMGERWCVRWRYIVPEVLSGSLLILIAILNPSDLLQYFVYR